jgi:NADH-quinone oxidoreductase subunit C
MSKLPDDFENRLRIAAPGGIELTQNTDAKGVTLVWCSLANKDELRDVAALIKAIDGRLSTISAFQPKAPEAEEEEESGEEGAEKEAKMPMTFGGTPLDGTSYTISYHFDIDGDTLTVSVFVPAGGAVDSLTPLFRNADWTEREFMEAYAIQVKGHPDPRRLFVDPAIDGAVLERLIPFSMLVNSASTKGLWEKIIGIKKGQQA